MDHNHNTTMNFNHFVKGDISGIQEFIFNVKSEGAAKSLKGRSFLIDALSLICIKMIEDKLGKENVKIFYNGGGNFFLEIFADPKDVVQELQEIINKTCKEHDFYITLSIVSNGSDKAKNDFGILWDNINHKCEKDKLNKFQNDFTSFEPYHHPIPKEPDSDQKEKLEIDWKELTRFLKNLNGYQITKLKEENYSLMVNYFGVQAFGYRLGKGDQPFKNTVLKMPLWTSELISDNKDLLKKIQVDNERKDPHYKPPKPGDIIEFSILARFAKKRTGTNKIAILKMDVDNLGKLFSELSYSSARSISKSISEFFKYQIESLLTQQYQSDNDTPIIFGENIYTIFSGGDDCFFVGAWDAILNWANLIQREFEKVSAEVDISILKDFQNREISEEIERIRPIGISAGYLMLEPSYPVTRFSEFVEKALKDAKYFTYNKSSIPTKNKINILGETLRWEELNQAIHMAELLRNHIQKNREPRSTIEKIRSSAIGFKEIHKNVLRGNLTTPSVSRLFYFLRNSPNQESISNMIVKPFSKDLIAAFSNGEESNPMKYPLAARFAEFLTRKS